MKNLIKVLGVGFALISLSILANEIATLRVGVPVSEEGKTDQIPKPITDDIKVARNYPMQPPVIPHNIRGYEMNLQVNKCMSCHSRKRVEETQATMISVTHYMDRDGNFLAEVSPRRYFCLQCHVPQTETPFRVGNDFVDMYEVIEQQKQKKQ